MKVLLSSFACSPYQGSEPGVGWRAMQQIAAEHEVFMICDEHARGPLERAAAEGLMPPAVQVRFIGKPIHSHPNRMIARLQSWQVYRNFTGAVLAAAAEWHRQVNFDLCHQVTVASFRVPSSLWRLPVPFVWGPIGGAGWIPTPFRSMLSPSARVFEKARDFTTTLTLRSRAFRDCVGEAAVVIAANEETGRFLAPFRAGRPMVQIPVMSLERERVEQFRQRQVPLPEGGPLRIFAGGSLIGSKGLKLALQALGRAQRQGVRFHYTISGGGSELGALQRVARQLGLEENVTFHPGYRGDEYVRALQTHHVFLLPSLRETLGITMIEAVLAGCYPIVADISAPGEIVRKAGGIAVKVDNQENMVAALEAAVVWCAGHREQLGAAAAAAGREIGDAFSSARYRELVNGAYQLALGA
jgi:glycosyltransferase involved in cell wall biosynthesis